MFSAWQIPRLWAWKSDAWHRVAAWRELCCLAEQVSVSGNCRDHWLGHHCDQRDDTRGSLEGGKWDGALTRLLAIVAQMSRVESAKKEKRTHRRWDKSLCQPNTSDHWLVSTTGLTPLCEYEKGWGKDIGLLFKLKVKADYKEKKYT